MIEYQGETYLTVNDIAARFCVSRATCYNNLLPHVPKCYLPGRRHALYKQSDVEQFAEVRIVASPCKAFPTSPLTAEVGNGSTSTLTDVTSNKPNFQSVIINGRPLKSINQFYNKRRAQLQKKLGKTGTTKRMERLTNKRNRRIDHQASRYIIDLLVKEGIGTLVIGKNNGWKQEANMGKRNNQNFVSIPHARFISMLTYKAELVGITVKITEESYTSKASFLDLDPLPVRSPDDNVEYTFSGKRVKRGLYRASNERYIHADCNGSGNIIRKVAPDAFGQRVVEDFAVHPVRITLTK